MEEEHLMLVLIKRSSRMELLSDSAKRSKRRRNQASGDCDNGQMFLTLVERTRAPRLI